MTDNDKRFLMTDSEFINLEEQIVELLEKYRNKCSMRYLDEEERVQNLVGMSKRVIFKLVT